MRSYEVVFTLVPSLSEDEIEQNIATFTQAAQQEGASIVGVDKWGKRKLAYPVKKHTEGYYVVVTLEEPAAQAVRELERRFKVTDSVIRFLTVRTDLDLKRAEKAKKKKEKRPPRQRQQ